MDFVSIGTSAVLSAILFILLEFTVILPLFKRIVTNAVNQMVQERLIPSISAYVDSKITDLTGILTKSLMQKIRGMMGGRQKGLNSLMTKLADPDLDIEDLDLDDYEPSTIDKIVTIAENLSPILQSPLLRGVNNGKEKEIVQQGEDKNSVQNSPQAQEWTQGKLL